MKTKVVLIASVLGLGFSLMVNNWAKTVGSANTTEDWLVPLAFCVGVLSAIVLVVFSVKILLNRAR